LTRCVLDASVLIKWFKPAGEADVEEAGALLRAYSSATLQVAAPRLVLLEVLNSGARRWRWGVPEIERLVSRLALLRFEFQEPSIITIGRWTLAGLTAYDACYLALAEELNTFVVTADDLMLRLGGDRARSLADAAAELGA